jgi:fructose-1,6-bisphosphatase/inositol monophosphatase family enzyme
MQFTRRIDKIAEDIVVQKIVEENITTYLISEELGEKIIGEGEPEIFIVVDPVDGTKNAIQRIPFFSTSLALGEYEETIYADSVKVGLVKDIYNNVTFYAERGKGAYENGEKISTSRVLKADNSLISLYAYRANIDYDKYIKITRAAKTRTMGSQALELCYVASGRIDACIDLRGVSRVVDVSAAKLILEEAGGLFRDLNGLEFNPPLKHANTFSFIAAPNREYLEDLKNLLKI